MTTGSRNRSALGLLLELATIVVGVFLGTAAEQWRSDRAERQGAQAALAGFRAEVADNRAALQAVRGYHAALADSMNLFLRTPGRHTLRDFLRHSGFHGTRTVDFEHTAYDLALASQALSHVPPPLAYAVARVYTRQQAFETIEHGFMQSAFAPATFTDSANGLGLAISMSAYLGDVNVQERQLLALYAALLPRLDTALGGPPPATALPNETPASPAERPAR